MYSERLARWHFGFTMIGFNAVFFTMHFLGLEGMPRRIYDYSQFYDLQFLWTLNWLATLGAFVLGFGHLFFFGKLYWTVVKGPRSGPDPWGRKPPSIAEPRVPS